MLCHAKPFGVALVMNCAALCFNLAREIPVPTTDLINVRLNMAVLTNLGCTVVVSGGEGKPSGTHERHVERR
jgi:hypothetical protein